MAILSKNEIKLLVEKSSLLTEVEKAEWVSLLPLMNDKQMMDLMSILSSGATQAPASSPVPKANGPLPSTNKQPNIVTSLGPMDDSLTKHDPRVIDAGRSQITLGVGSAGGFPVVPVKPKAQKPTESAPQTPEKPVTFSHDREKVSSGKEVSKQVFTLPHNAQSLLQLDLSELSSEQFDQLSKTLVGLKDAWGYENFASLFRQSPFYKKYIGSVSDLLSGKPSAFSENLLNQLIDMMILLRK